MQPSAHIVIGDSRSMPELQDSGVDLIVTSPPYWHIKDYGTDGQIGFGQSLHDYLRALYQVWSECARVLRPGGRICINIGDQFARSIIYGRYKVIPLHAEVIAQCERLGLDFLGSVIWQKKTTMNTTGGAAVMGSFPYPPNGIVEIDYEFIHIFKKPGPAKKVSREVRDASKLSTAEWKEYFSGHWYFGGAKQIEHEAMFPEELPRRLIRMFSFPGDVVLDPFMGSGTTAKVALSLGRNAVGYELNGRFEDVIEEKLGVSGALPGVCKSVSITSRPEGTKPSSPDTDYTPAIQDAEPKVDPEKFNFKGPRLYRVADVVSADTLRMNTGLSVTFAGVCVDKRDEAVRYLTEYVLGKDVILKFDENADMAHEPVPACVYLKNRIFINAHLVKAGMASPDPASTHRLKDKFVALWNERQAGG